MFKRSGFVTFFILFLVSTTVFSEKTIVFGSTDRDMTIRRPDPLNHFKLYKGVYDIRNKHYWASAAFTGIHGFAIAGIWVFCGLGLGSYMILRNFNGNSSSIQEHSDSSHLVMFWLIVFFSFLVIVASGLVIAANQSCLQRIKNLEETVLGAGSAARRAVLKVAQSIKEMEDLLHPYDPYAYRLLNSTGRQLGRESRMIRSFVQKNKHTINKSIQISYAANLTVVTVNLAFLVAGIVLLLLHWYPGLLIIILFCWILTTLCWVLTGFDYFLYTFADDTCSALEDFEQNPENNSLSSVLPCTNSSYSDSVLMEIGYTVHSSISEINLKITQINKLLQLGRGNQDSSGIQNICDPFSGFPNYTYTPESCPQNATPIGDLPDVLSKFTCYKENTGNCARDEKFIPEATYVKAWAYSVVIQNLINIFPDLQSLLQCSIVKNTFSSVVLHQCRPFRSSAEWLWLFVLFLSTFMVILVLLWIGKAFRDRGRSFSLCSITPNPAI